MSREARGHDSPEASAAEQSLPTQRAPVHDTVDTGHEVGERLHLMRIAMGMFDARLSRVDFFDTEGGREVMRLYHRHQPRRRRAGHDKRTAKAA